VLTSLFSFLNNVTLGTIIAWACAIAAGIVSVINVHKYLLDKPKLSVRCDLRWPERVARGEPLGTLFVIVTNHGQRPGTILRLHGTYADGTRKSIDCRIPGGNLGVRLAENEVFEMALPPDFYCGLKQLSAEDSRGFRFNIPYSDYSFLHYSAITDAEMTTWELTVDAFETARDYYKDVLSDLFRRK
jgi:hypothetical protein